MKNKWFLLYPAAGTHFLWVAACLVSMLMISCTSSNEKNKTGTSGQNNSDTLSASDPLDGTWELVWAKSDGQVTTNGKPSQLKMFHDGFFSLIMQDSTGKWTTAIAGTYETNGNTYKETVRYCSMPEYIGATDWQEFEIKGDTLYKRLFTKVVLANGEDITSRFPKIEEKRVRAKK